MDSRRLVLRETGVIAIGVVIGVAAMMAVFAIAGYFDRTVLLGGIVGGIVSILNFFFMAVNTMSAADKAVSQNVKMGKAQIKLSYGVRMLAIFAILFVCVKSGACNAIAAVLPLVFVRPTITIAEFFRKPGGDK